VTKAVESIYRDLEYARSIIKFSQERHDSDGTDVGLDGVHDEGQSIRALSDEWNMVDGGHIEHGKESSGILAPLKRVSLGLGLTTNAHPSRPN
jgi:hypothetical protein